MQIIVTHIPHKNLILIKQLHTWFKATTKTRLDDSVGELGHQDLNLSRDHAHQAVHDSDFEKSRRAAAVYAVSGSDSFFITQGVMLECSSNSTAMLPVSRLTEQVCE